METETLVSVWIGKNERETIEDALRHFGGIATFLSRKELVGSVEKVIFFTAFIDAALEARVQEEERIARDNYAAIQNRGIRVSKWQVCDKLRDAQADLSKFRGRLEEARAEDAKWRAEQDAKKAAELAANVATSAPAVQVAEG